MSGEPTSEAMKTETLNRWLKNASLILTTIVAVLFIKASIDVARLQSENAALRDENASLLFHCYVEPEMVKQ